jgi:hypothetical protein
MFDAEKSKLALILLSLAGLIVIGFGTALAIQNAGPEISIPSDIPALPNSTVSIPVNFKANGSSITALAFSIDYDETLLSFDPSLANSITFNFSSLDDAKGFCDVDTTDTDGEIDCAVADIKKPLIPFPDGTFLTIKLRTLNAPENITVPVGFSKDPDQAPIFFNTDGLSEEGTTVDGSVYFGEITWINLLPMLSKQTPIPPTPTPPPQDCDEIIENGGFEDESDKEDDGEGWEIEVTAYTASFSGVKFHSGDRSLFTGIFDDIDNTYSWSSGNQIVTIPSAADDATLTFWNYPRSKESAFQRLSAYIWARVTDVSPNTPLAFDMQYVAVKDLTAGTDAKVIFWQISNSRDWEKVELDLSDYIGHTIQIWFTTYNDGFDGVSSMFVDDVSLEACK